MDLEAARDVMLIAASVFERWRARLEFLAARLPDPRFDAESDEPVNLSASIKRLLEGLLCDGIQESTKALRSAAGWVDDSAGRRSPSQD